MQPPCGSLAGRRVLEVAGLGAARAAWGLAADEVAALLASVAVVQAD